MPIKGSLLDNGKHTNTRTHIHTHNDYNSGKISNEGLFIVRNYSLGVNINFIGPGILGIICCDKTP